MGNPEKLTTLGKITYTIYNLPYFYSASIQVVEDTGEEDTSVTVRANLFTPWIYKDHTMAH
jgi:hypothetical protein